SDALQLCVFLFFLIYRFPPLVTLFPYTTLFRSEANLQGLPSANSFGYISAEFHIHLKATVGYLGIYFFNTQRVTFSRKCELAFQVGVNARYIVFINISSYFEPAQHVDLPQTLARITVLSDLGIEGCELAVDRRPHNQVANFATHQV